MNYWLISDTHFNHSNLEKWGGRSGDWQEQLWKGIDAIPAGDILIHLGDICIGNDAEVHEKLGHGGGPETRKHILVKGNHDKKSTQWYSEHGWDFVCDGLELIYRGHYLHFTHRPARPQGNTSWNIHGHTHGNLHRSEESTDFYDNNYHIDISPELVGYKPIRLDQLLDDTKRTSRRVPTRGAEVSREVQQGQGTSEPVNQALPSTQGLKEGNYNSDGAGLRVDGPSLEANT